MPIEFTCLACGSRLQESDEKAGSRSECSACGAALTVPRPIGGALTEKRLRAAAPTLNPSAAAPVAAPPSMVPAEQAEPARSPAARRDLIPADVPQPSSGGIRIQFEINALCGRDTRQTLEESVKRICETLVNHIELAPQYFRSASLVLDIQRFDLNDERLDSHARLVGWLNGEEFTHSASIWIDQRPARGAIAMLSGAWLTYQLLDLLVPRRRSRVLENSIARRLQIALDEAADRPLSWWTRFRQAAGTEA